MQRPELLRQICARHARRAPLNISAVKRYAPELLEAAYSYTPFLGWRKALEAAGISYAEITIELKDTVLCPLCGQEMKSLSTHLRNKHASCVAELRAEFPGLQGVSETMAAQRMQRAPTELPLPDGRTLLVPHWEPVLSPEYALDRVYHFYELGFALHSRNLMRLSVPLRSYIHQVCPSYNEMLRMLKLRPEDIQIIQHKHRGKAELIEIIRSWQQQNRRLGTVLIDREHPGFRFAIKQQFGNFANALEAAGVDGRANCRIVKYPLADRGDLLARTRQFCSKELVTRDELAAFRRDNYALMLAFFKNWGALARAAGFPAQHLHFDRHGKQRKRPLAKPSAAAFKRMIAEARALAAKAQPDRRAIAAFRDRYRTEIIYFPSWQDFAARAGIPPQALGFGLNDYADCATVITELRRRAQHGETISKKNIRFEDPDLFAAVMRLFGGWQSALAQAGLSVIRNRPKYCTPQSVCDELRQRHARGLSSRSTALQLPTTDPASDKPLYLAIQRFYPSVEAAQAAAGVPVQPAHVRKTYATEDQTALHHRNASTARPAEPSAPESPEQPVGTEQSLPESAYSAFVASEP